MSEFYGRSDEAEAVATIHCALSLLDSRALPAPGVPRVGVDPSSARALSRDQLRAIERETDRLSSSRDRAILELLLRMGLQADYPPSTGGEVPQRPIVGTRASRRLETSRSVCAASVTLISLLD